MSMVIVVDLDGTLIEHDSSFEIWKGLFKKTFFTKDFLISFKAIFVYFFYGEARAKELIEPFSFVVEHIVNEQVLNYLTEKKKDHRIILATGASARIAHEFSEKYNLFDDVISSNANLNCIGANKLAAIRKLVLDDNFMYIGDHWHDFPIWQAASKIGVAKPSKGMLFALRALGKDVVVFGK